MTKKYQHILKEMDKKERQISRQFKFKGSQENPESLGAGNRGRTGTISLPQDFKRFIYHFSLF